MNSNVKEIGHVSFKIYDEIPFRNFYENELKLKTGFILKTEDGKDRIIYYQLNHGQFLEVFPKTKSTDWADYDGHSNEDKLSYQYTTLGKGDHPEMIRDHEGNLFEMYPGAHYISKVTYKVNNIEKSKKFYTDILALNIISETPNAVQIKINDEQIVELLNQPYTGDNHSDNKGFCHYSLIVKDIEAEARRLEQIGYLMTAGPLNSGHPYTKENPYKAVKHSEKSYNFYIQDPDFNEIEVMSYSAESYQVKYATE